MAHLDHVVDEVQGLDLGEGSAGADRLRGQHGDGGPQFVLAGRRDAPGGQQRGAQDHPGAEPFVLLAVQAAVVVGHGVQVEVLHQPVQADRHLSRPRRSPRRSRESSSVKISRARSIRSATSASVTASRPVRRRSSNSSTSTWEPKVVEQQGQVGGDVEHARIEVAHQPVPGVAQRAARTPAAWTHWPIRPQARSCSQAAGDRPEVDAGAAEDVADLGHRALAAVGQPLAGVEGGVVHRSVGCRSITRTGASARWAIGQHHRRRSGTWSGSRR